MLATGDQTHGIVTGLPEAVTRTCPARVAPVLGFTLVDDSDGSLELQIPDNPIVLAWHGDMLAITQAHHGASSGNRRRCSI
jgi:hypothetical protein